MVRYDYNHFLDDAKAFLTRNHYSWSHDKIVTTVSTLWNAHPTVKHHYAGTANRPSPGLPNPCPLPTTPFTKPDAKRARKFGFLPPNYATINVQPGHAPAPGPAPAPVQPAPLQPAPVPPVQPAPTSASETAQPAAEASRTKVQHDRRPYEFWPQLPWEEEDILVVPRAEHDLLSDNHPEVNAWLEGKPRKPSETDESMWHGAKYLGAGSYGIAGLWVKTNVRGDIVDTMVIKDARNMGSNNWRDPRFWRDGLPSEVRVHQLVEDRRKEVPDDCRHLIRCFGHRLIMTQMRYRLYLELCTSGNLYDAMDPGAKVNRSPPEAYIWYLIRALATALLVLRDGKSRGFTKAKGWNPIHHLDVQLPNVFFDFRPLEGLVLEESDAEDTHVRLALTAEEFMENMYPNGWKGKRKADQQPDDQPKQKRPRSIPTAFIEPVLADFGLAFFSPPYNKEFPVQDNPHDYLLYSQWPKYAPEHQNQRGPPFTPLDEKTDIWGIGQIAWALIANNRNGAVREDRFGPEDENGDRKHIPIPLGSRYEGTEEKLDSGATLANVIFKNARHYSDELRGLVRSFLEWKPDNRPDLVSIIYDANEWLHENEERWEDFTHYDRLRLDLSQYSAFEKGRRFKKRT